MYVILLSLLLVVAGPCQNATTFSPQTDVQKDVMQSFFFYFTGNHVEKIRRVTTELPPKQTAKVLLVGDCGVGKSAILSSYRGERFNPCYVQTRGEMKNAFIGMHTINLEV